jgi:hypothetical protein
VGEGAGRRPHRRFTDVLGALFELPGTLFAGSWKT